MVQEFTGTMPAGSVVSQSPGSGAEQVEAWVFRQACGAVSLVVSPGPKEPESVVVPNVVGQTQAAAESAITGEGLTVGNVTQQHHEGVPAGSVISQNPTTGASVSPGSAVGLVISLGHVGEGEGEGEGETPKPVSCNGGAQIGTSGWSEGLPIFLAMLMMLLPWATRKRRTNN